MSRKKGTAKEQKKLVSGLFSRKRAVRELMRTSQRGSIEKEKNGQNCSVTSSSPKEKEKKGYTDHESEEDSFERVETGPEKKGVSQNIVIWRSIKLCQEKGRGSRISVTLLYSRLSHRM